MQYGVRSGAIGILNAVTYIHRGISWEANQRARILQPRSPPQCEPKQPAQHHPTWAPAASMGWGTEQRASRRAPPPGRLGPSRSKRLLTPRWRCSSSTLLWHHAPLLRQTPLAPLTAPPSTRQTAGVGAGWRGGGVRERPAPGTRLGGLHASSPDAHPCTILDALLIRQFWTCDPIAWRAPHGVLPSHTRTWCPLQTSLSSLPSILMPTCGGTGQAAWAPVHTQQRWWTPEAGASGPWGGSCTAAVFSYQSPRPTCTATRAPHLKRPPPPFTSNTHHIGRPVPMRWHLPTPPL